MNASDLNRVCDRQNKHDEQRTQQESALLQQPKSEPTSVDPLIVELRECLEICLGNIERDTLPRPGEVKRVREAIAATARIEAAPAQPKKRKWDFKDHFALARASGGDREKYGLSLHRQPLGGFGNASAIWVRHPADQGKSGLLRRNH